MSTTKDKIFFPGTNRPIAFFFTVVPLLTVALIGYCMWRYKLPYVLIGLLILLAGSCLYLAKEALSDLGDVTLELSPNDLTVRRMVGSATYAWNDIEQIKLIDPGATFCDNAADDEKRAGIGLFLRKPDRKEAPADDNPDVLLIVRAGEEAAKVAKTFDRISAMKRGGNSGRGGKAINGPAKTFRKPAAAA